MSNRHILNMANSIIGVSILSMPYCFKETGVLLGISLLLLSGFITKKTCMFLINSAIMSRRRSYELLAFQVFGPTGKLLMELCMILFLLGICISFHVVMGDLAPAITAKYLDIDNTPKLRMLLLIGIVVVVILPLCLLRNLDSLASMSACSIGFYIFLTGVIFIAAVGRLISGSWIEHATMFRFENIFRVFPIMVLALSCQSNVFEIYYSIPDPDVKRMETVVSQAVNLCIALYTSVGFLGYVAFIDKDIGGNIILDFPNSNMTDGITMVFVISLAISFPLMLFPCRTSIHSLLFKKNNPNSYDLVNFIPENKFKVITVMVLVVSLTIGINLPDIEFVLGLLGSTMGMMISLILPSLFYIRVQTKLSIDRLLAQAFMLMALVLMVTGTYLHLAALQTSPQKLSLPQNLGIKIPLEDLAIESDLIKPLNVQLLEVNHEEGGRKEPAIPEPPSDTKKEDSDNLKQLDKVDKLYNKLDPVPPDAVQSNSKKASSLPLKEKRADVFIGDENNLRAKDVLHSDAIEKEDHEHAKEKLPEESVKNQVLESKQEEILKQMEDQQHKQKHMIEQQQEILKELKVQKEKIEVIENNLDEVPVAQLQVKDYKEDNVHKLVLAAQEVLKEISNLPEEVKKLKIPVKDPSNTNMKPIVNLIDSMAAQGNQEEEKVHLDDTVNKIIEKPIVLKADPVVLRVNPIAPQANQVDPQVNPVAPQINPVAPQINPVAPQINQVLPQINPVHPRLNPGDLQVNPVVPPANPVIPPANPVAPQDELAVESVHHINIIPDIAHVNKPFKKPTERRSIKNLLPPSDINRIKPLSLRNGDRLIKRVKQEPEIVKHDEERRKRDLREFDLQKYSIHSKAGEDREAVNSENVLNNVITDFNSDKNINLEVGSIFYESRRLLLWRTSRHSDTVNIGRRKKRHKQNNPDYWDEM